MSRLGERAAQYGLVLLVALTLNFLLPRLMPGSPLAFLAGEEVGQLTSDEIAEVRRRFGLDRTLPEQYLRYLAAIATGDWGYSFQAGRPVMAVIRERLPWTVLLAGTSLLLATVLGTLLGAVAAWRRGGWLDTSTLSGFILLDSLPTFWLGMVLVAVFAVQLGWLPIFGASSPWGPRSGLPYTLDVLRHLALPAATLTASSLAGAFMVMRYSMLQTLGEDYIRTARAKGLAERDVLFGHATRNALLPVATAVMLNLGFLFGGATVVETVFSYPGIGSLLFQAVISRDYPLLQGAFLMLTVSVIAANLVADAIYPILDPRVRGGE